MVVFKVFWTFGSLQNHYTGRSANCILIYVMVQSENLPVYKVPQISTRLLFIALAFSLNIDVTLTNNVH